MKSTVNVTYQMDDPALAAEELLAGAEAGGGNRLGLLFTYSDTDVAGLAEALSARAAFPVVGCTCIASMDHAEGFHELAASLMILSAEDCAFAAAAAPDPAFGSVGDRVADAVARVRAALPDEPKLIFALPPYTLHTILDEYVEALGLAAPGVPVIGGLPSYNSHGDECLTILDGSVYADNMVLFAVSGNLRPLFSVRNVLGTSVERKRKVTAAEGNILYRVGDEPLTEYMRGLGLPIDRFAGGNETGAFISLLANPLFVEHAGEAGAPGYSFIRTLHALDLEKGSGIASGVIPVGATISISSLRREEIEETAAQAAAELSAKIAEADGGYAYTTVLLVSCIGRYLLMSPKSDSEARALLSGLPSALALNGFYSYGEIGPLPRADGNPPYFAHNESLVLCAF